MSVIVKIIRDNISREFNYRKQENPSWPHASLNLFSLVIGIVTSVMETAKSTIPNVAKKHNCLQNVKSLDPDRGNPNQRALEPLKMASVFSSKVTNPFFRNSYVAERLGGGEECQFLFFFFKSSSSTHFLFGVCHLINFLKNMVLNAGALVTMIHNPHWFTTVALEKVEEKTCNHKGSNFPNTTGQ